MTPSLGHSYLSCQLWVQFCTVGCEDRIWEREAQESLLLVAVARERLMKTQQAGKRLSVWCGDLESVEISGGAVPVVPIRVYKWWINPFIDPYPVYSHALINLVKSCYLMNIVFRGLTLVSHSGGQSQWTVYRFITVRSGTGQVYHDKERLVSPVPSTHLSTLLRYATEQTIQNVIKTCVSNCCFVSDPLLGCKKICEYET
jgi:hypothetical protein